MTHSPLEDDNRLRQAGMLCSRPFVEVPLLALAGQGGIAASGGVGRRPVRAAAGTHGIGGGGDGASGDQAVASCSAVWRRVIFPAALAAFLSAKEGVDPYKE